MHSTTIETVVAHRSVLGEGPVWDEDKQRILWIDIVGGIIHQFTPATSHFSSFSVGEMIGSLALTTDGGLVAALESGFSFLDLSKEAKRPIANPEKHIRGNRFNEGKCDPGGRFWAGTLPLSEDRAAGSVYTLHHDLSVEKKIENVTISNGMAWSKSGETFYYIDSPTFSVVSYHYDAATGSISDRRVCIKMNEQEGTPDGMTIDDEGMLWIAHWGGSKVARWDASSGEKLMQIDLPVTQVTSCTFGGADFNDLYITSASIRLTEAQLRLEPLAGSLFVARNCGFRGMPASKFKHKR